MAYTNLVGTGVPDGPKIKKLQRVNNQPVGDGAFDVPKTNDYRKQNTPSKNRWGVFINDENGGKATH